MRKRTVIEIERTDTKTELRLSCGHIVNRHERGRTPKAIDCPECARLYGNCQQQAGWFSGRKARVPMQFLQLFEAEGLIKRSTGIRSAGIRWRVVGA